LKRGIILQHGDLGPPGVFEDWLRERGIDYEVHAAWRDRFRTCAGPGSWRPSAPSSQ
jgi:hypothetical protein